MVIFSFLFLLLFCVYTVQVLCAGESNEGVVQVLDPFLQLPTLYNKYLYLSYSHLPYITSTGPCQQLLPLYHKYWSLSTVTSPLSQVLVPCQQLPPLYHKYWSLSTVTSPISQVLVPYITNSGLCPTVTAPISQIVDPVLLLQPK